MFLSVAPTSGLLINKEEFNNYNDPNQCYLLNKTIYVDDDALPGGNGSLQHPFQNIIDGINAADNGDTVFVFNGTYEEYLEFSKSIKLIGENQQTTVLCGHSGIEVSDVEGLVVNGFYLNESVGIHLYRIYNSYITNNILKYSDISLSNSSYNVIKGNYIIKSRTNGIRLWYKSEYNDISENTIYGEGINVNTGNNTILSNKLNNCNIQVSRYNNNVVSNNLIENINGSYGATGIEVHWCENTIVSENIIRNLSGDIGATGIDIVYSGNTSVFSNTITNLSGSNGAIGISITFDDSNSATVAHNTIKNIYGGTGAYGIKIGSSSYHKLNGNTISDITSNGYSDGINIEDSSYIEITGNVIDQCGYSCIYFTYSDNNNIKNNILTGTLPVDYGFGICFGGFVKKTIISENIIVNNSRGMYLSIGCWRNTISKNIIMDNSEGLLLGRGNNEVGGASNNIIFANEISRSTIYGIHCEKGSRNNKLYCNNFIDNSNEEGGNAYDEGFNLWFWFKFFRLKGNYWDDFETNPGFVMGKYKVPPKLFFNTDWFPLKEPFDISQI